jgi:tetratricopeptide (TPR) repeat protein
LGAVLFSLFLSISLTASRGATLSLAISVGLLTVLTLRSVSRRALVLLLGLLAVAFLVSKISHGELGERLPQLIQDSPRRIIWESSWSLLQASPWQGIGLGLFYLAYPAYRNPADNSGGFFAHNDYLQVWIETGLPGLMLLLAVLVAALWLFVRALRKTGLRSGVHIEMTGLFCGLLAVAGHSVVDFNLYILSIMMMSGLAMARFHELATRNLKPPLLLLRPSRFVGKQAYPLIVLLLVLLPVFYFIALGMANSYYDRGMAQAREGRLQEADQSLATAQRLTPSDDRILIAHADLYRHAVAMLPPDDFGGRKSLYDDALHFLEQAQKANALRGLTFVIRGRLYQQNPAFAGEDGQELAGESFRHALALNPRLFQGRMDYVSLLLQAGKKNEALQSLDEGVRHYYPNMPDLIPFYSLTAQLQKDAGRVDEARVLEDRVKELEKLTTTGYQLRGY